VFKIHDPKFIALLRLGCNRLLDMTLKLELYFELSFNLEYS